MGIQLPAAFTSAALLKLQSWTASFWPSQVTGLTDMSGSTTVMVSKQPTQTVTHSCPTKAGDVESQVVMLYKGQRLQTSSDLAIYRHDAKWKWCCVKRTQELSPRQQMLHDSKKRHIHTARGWKKGEMEWYCWTVLLRTAILQGEKSFRDGRGSGCTIPQMYLILLNNLKFVKMENFMVWICYNIFKELRK